MITFAILIGYLRAVLHIIIRNQDGWVHLVFAYSVESVDLGDTADFYALPLCHSVLTTPEQDEQAIDAAGVIVSGLASNN